MYTSKRLLLEDTKCNYKNKEQSIVLASNTYLFSLMVYHGENDLHFDEMMMMMSAFY